uniref:Uncharacterized protein n=1 Tax=Anguilla anguilla TaxID=7936 RepID=A0A0E9ST46_ANGAN
MVFPEQSFLYSQTCSESEKEKDQNLLCAENCPRKRN